MLQLLPLPQSTVGTVHSVDSCFAPHNSGLKSVGRPSFLKKIMGPVLSFATKNTAIHI